MKWRVLMKWWEWCHGWDSSSWIPYPYKHNNHTFSAFPHVLWLFLNQHFTIEVWNKVEKWSLLLLQNPSAFLTEELIFLKVPSIYKRPFPHPTVHTGSHHPTFQSTYLCTLECCVLLLMIQVQKIRSWECHPRLSRTVWVTLQMEEEEEELYCQTREFIVVSV